MPLPNSRPFLARSRNIFLALLLGIVLIVSLLLVSTEQPSASAGQAGFAGQSGAAGTASQEEQLWQLRNLGKAFYENPTTQKEAVDTFKQAFAIAPNSVRERLNYGLALLHAGSTEEGVAELLKVQQSAPAIPNPWFVLGVHYRKSGEDAKAMAQFEQLERLDPNEAKTQYNLGVLLKQKGDNAGAIRKFERAAELEPSLAAPHFQLFNVYRLAGDREKANARLALFREIKKQQEGAVIPEDMDWSDYAEIYDPIDPAVAQGDAAEVPRLVFAAEQLAGKADAATAGSLVFDAMGNGRPALLVWSSTGVRLYAEGAPVLDSPPLNALKEVRDVSAADFNNDGLLDLCVITPQGVTLLANNKGGFASVGGGAEFRGAYTQALWLDYDHDYDLDLILLGARPTVLRNQAEAGFVPQADAIPFVNGSAVAGAVIRQIPDSKAFDFLVSYRDRAGVLYKDRLGGSYEARDLHELPAAAHHLRVGDFTSDGALDFAYLLGSNATLVENRRGTWLTRKTVPAAGSFLFADFANLALQDWMADGVLLANDRSSFTQSREMATPAATHALAAADLNLDGKLDFAGVGSDGTIIRYLNQTDTPNRWLRVSLNGVKAPKAARGTVVEVKAGGRYQKHVYESGPLHIGIRSYDKVDTIRLTWPNGLIQNEMNQPSGKAYTYDEAQRLSGSCPMIFTWDGREFTFITDVLGVAPLGAKSGDGSYFPTNSDEYVWIDGEHLRPRDGILSVRITEELGEVSYLDRLELIAVDHPAGVDIFSNEKWKGPPYPEFRLFGTTTREYPRLARSQGTDVLASLQMRDQIYVDNFERNFQNVAEMHTLDLDFGDAAPRNTAFLVLNGWVDWADGSTFLAQQQAGESLVPPYLQVRNAQGEWQTVVEDMGMPSGKTKTLAVDLSGKFLTANRELRIVTNMCVFWDEVFLGEDTATPTVALTSLPARSAQMRYHGFSTSIIHPQRKKPEHFLYEPTTVLSYWNPTRGNYTRFGDILTLIESADDRLAIMGAADEVALEFDASAAPALRDGWKRDYLLLVEGWAKDADANTGFGSTVEPLPFRKMTRYPYPAGETYPKERSLEEYRRAFNTRPALRYTRPLAP
ncbi:MAG: FG-GAP-like repeat-containing protein [Bryobacterales bacterium]|nr:FG-GAP-like repeat-containing protein [Bryobacterales bacterium]